MKAELEYQVSYEYRDWRDDSTWIAKGVQFTVRSEADDFAAWLGSKEWARYVGVESRRADPWCPVTEDRPTPPVELPTEPTLGWATIHDPSAGGSRGTELGIWESADNQGRSVHSEIDRLLQREREFDANHVTAFTPAVAVPAAALDELRAAMASSYSTTGAVHKFLTAVDNADGTP